MQGGEIKWDVVYTTARLHGVAPLIYRNLQSCFNEGLKIPQDVIERFRLCYYGNIAAEKRRSERIKKILSLADKMSVDIMLIKGAALRSWCMNIHGTCCLVILDLIVMSRKTGVTDKRER